MTETDEMEELFEKLPWLKEQFELEDGIIEKQVGVELLYKKVLEEVEWVEH